MDSIHKSTKKGSHITREDRLLLEFYSLGKGKFPKITKTAQLASILECSQRTIQRELQRGKVEHVTTDLQKIIEYNADYAQQNAEYNMSAKGAALKIGKDNQLCHEISSIIKKQSYSPYAVIQYFNNTHWPTQTRICTKTLYSYIYEGLIEDITQKDLLLKGKRRKSSGKPKSHNRAGCAQRSISKRPETINDRSEIGHWEIDTVKSAENTTKECILTLTERKLRLEIIRKIPDAKTESVVNSLDYLEKSFEPEIFKSLFKSITADNGSEFMDYDGIEKSVMGETKRCIVFFAHPYRACERGTNENHNGIIRRFVPKKSDFSQIPETRFLEIQDWMNNYPRKKLGGKTPLMKLREYFGEEFSLPG